MGHAYHRLTRCFAPEPHAVTAARRASQDVAEQLEPARWRRLGLLVSELVSDSVRHLGGDHGGWIRLDISWSDRSIRVEVTSPDTRFAGPRGLVSLQPGGSWSLVVIDALSDAWGFGD